MKIPVIKAITLLIFNPKRLKALTVEYTEAKNIAEINAKKSRDQESKYFHLENSIDKIRLGLLHSFLLMLGTIVVGFTLGKIGYYFFGNLPHFWYVFLQYGGIGILLWATLAIQGWSIQTIGGHSFPEIINEWVYRFLYILGSLLLVLSVSWPTNEVITNVQFYCNRM